MRLSLLLLLLSFFLKCEKSGHLQSPGLQVSLPPIPWVPFPVNEAQKMLKYNSKNSRRSALSGGWKGWRSALVSFSFHSTPRGEPIYEISSLEEPWYLWYRFIKNKNIKVTGGKWGWSHDGLRSHLSSFNSHTFFFFLADFFQTDQWSAHFPPEPIYLVHNKIHSECSPRWLRTQPLAHGSQCSGSKMLSLIVVKGRIQRENIFEIKNRFL